jgi:hypothetical protein
MGEDPSMPQQDSWRNGEDLTREEWAAIHSARLEALSAATVQVTRNEPIPIKGRMGWDATVEVLRRDSDGSARAVITVTGPGLARPYVRRVRLVKEQRSRTGSG